MDPSLRAIISLPQSPRKNLRWFIDVLKQNTRRSLYILSQFIEQKIILSGLAWADNDTLAGSPAHQCYVRQDGWGMPNRRSVQGTDSFTRVPSSLFLTDAGFFSGRSWDLWWGQTFTLPAVLNPLQEGARERVSAEPDWPLWAPTQEQVLCRAHGQTRHKWASVRFGQPLQVPAGASSGGSTQVGAVSTWNPPESPERVLQCSFSSAACGQPCVNSSAQLAPCLIAWGGCPLPARAKDWCDGLVLGTHTWWVLNSCPVYKENAFVRTLEGWWRRIIVLSGGNGSPCNGSPRGDRKGS